jgi:hypothetical protein
MVHILSHSLTDKITQREDYHIQFLKGEADEEVTIFNFIGWKGASYVEKEKQFEEKESFVPGVGRGLCFVHNRKEHRSEGDSGGSGIPGLCANGIGDRL